MGKSSSSLKKKRSKYSSSGWRKKRSKSRRAKSKKLRLRDDSESSIAASSSSSEDSNKGRKSRSFTRKDVKVSKKKSRARSYSSEGSPRVRKQKRSKKNDEYEGKKKMREKSWKKKTRRDPSISSSSTSSGWRCCLDSSEDNDYERRTNMSEKRDGRRKFENWKNDEYEGKKKMLEKSRKKKTRRDPSISSASSGSRYFSTCSTCRSESDSREDSAYERRTNMLGRRDGRRKLEKVKSGTRRKRDSSSSSSSYSRQNEDTDHWSEKKMNTEITSKRLRSVVVFAKEDNEGRDLDKDENKEEMIYDHDDYPSSRSNDSNDGGIKGDLAHLSSFETDRKRQIDDDQEGYAFAFKNKATGLSETDKDREGQNVAFKLESNRVRTDKYAINDSKNEFSGVIGSTDSDLESILRQRALENLKRFRGGSQATVKRHVNPKDDSGDSLKLSLAIEAQSDQIRSSKNDGARVAREGSTCTSLLKDDNVTEMKNAGPESVSLESKVHPTDADAGRPNVRATTVYQRIKRPRLVATALKQALSDATTTPREAATLPESKKMKAVVGNSLQRGSAKTSHIVNSPSDNINLDKVSNVLLKQEPFDAAVNPVPVELNTLRESNQAIMGTGITVGETAGQAFHVTPGSSNSENAKVENVTSFGSVEPSHVESALGDIDPIKLEDEGTEDSQYQQKTMSVMRGGELVQVSYKVYIPKKAPALARRRLKR